MLLDVCCEWIASSLHLLAETAFPPPTQLANKAEFYLAQKEKKDLETWWGGAKEKST